MKPIEKLYENAKYAKIALEEATTRYALIQEDLDKRLELVREVWRKENAEMIDEYTAVQACAVESDDAVRQEAVAEYNATGEKQVIDGVSVRVNKRLEYDASVALDFAKTHGICLQLDKKEFEKVARTIAQEIVLEVESVSAVVSYK